MKILKTTWFPVSSTSPLAVGIVKVNTGKKPEYFIGIGEGKSSRKVSEKIVENGFRFYPEFFSVKMEDCYCHTCNKNISPHEILKHREVHRDKKEDCTITYKEGVTISYKFSKGEE